MNLAQRQDGADARLAVPVHAARELATRLTDLGYVLVPRADGNGFAIGGVAQEVMEALSSRRAQITPRSASRTIGVERVVERVTADLQCNQRFGRSLPCCMRS